mgnify:CR=1 FL=1
MRIPHRINKYGYIESKDYVISYLDRASNYLVDSFTQKGESDNQVNRKDYGLTINGKKTCYG